MESTSHNFFTLLSILVICFAVCFVGTLSEDAEVPYTNIKKLATANNDLALKIYRRLATESSRNIFFSPFSLSTAFGMLYYGSKGETAKKLREVLGYETANLSNDLIHKTFHEYLTEYLPNNDSSSYALKFANAVLFDKRLKIISTYKKNVQDFYQASVKVVNFKSERAQILNEVNTWVSEKTNGKIDKLVEDLDPGTSFMLLNAVYFKGEWKKQFQPNRTAPATFFNNGLESESKKVPMMRMTGHLLYNDAFGVQALELPYKGKNIMMIVLLPNDRNGLDSLEGSLTLDKISSIRKNMKRTKVELTFPKFKLEYNREMKSDFETLGAKEIFYTGADFSGITSDDIAVNQVIHKAVLEVNEEGSEAAAVTGVISSRKKPQVKNVEFIADHPFMLAIVDTINDMTLFLGRVSNL